ncbi:MAG TPA: hypothetical protein EYQ31_00180 [Candidatus Handelsmanbacteria bacterium]|nr:hypothetical protein [Candidatus Handelsmanbacteria bacterium]
MKTEEDGTTVFAVAAPTDEVRDLLSLLEEADIDPRIVSLDTFGFTKLVSSALETKSDASGGQGCVALVDLGHDRTDITVMMDGKLAFARTIRRGAHQISRVLAKQLNVPEDQAHRTMVAHGRLLKPSEVDQLKKNPSNEQAKSALRMNDALRQGLEPILRDINQTLRSHEQLHKEPVEKLFREEWPTCAGLISSYTRPWRCPVIPSPRSWTMSPSPCGRHRTPPSTRAP